MFRFVMTVVILSTVTAAGAAGNSIASDPPEPLPIHPVSPGEDLGRLPEWFSAPVQRDRHTTFLARFEDGITADYARGTALAAGKAFRAGVPGRLGRGVEISDLQAQVNYRGSGNLRPACGTLQFWIKANPAHNLWNDSRDHWFFSSRAIDNDLELRKDSRNLLVLSWGRWMYGERGHTLGALGVPVADLDPAAWHHIAFSWQSRPGRLWLAVDGRVRSLGLARPMDVDEFMIFFLGATHEGGYHNTKAAQPLYLSATADAVVDEVKASDLPIPELMRLHDANGGVSESEYLRVLDALRKHYDFVATLQEDGAWSAPFYSWPHLLPGLTSYRTYFRTGRIVDVNHGRTGTPSAGLMYLYAYRVLGDRKYLEIAEKAGDWIRAAQQPEGYWAGGYESGYERRTAARPVMPAEAQGARLAFAKPAMHDGMQSIPTVLLGLLYLETRHPRWLAACRKAADFLVSAQNPNGSWSHNYDVARKRGENRHQHYRAGDLSNGIMHSQMTAMLVAYQITRERKYLDALRRAGEWILAAQQGPPTFGWAAHYDARNRPAWGRAWEPPAVSGAGAPDLALFMFDITGDRRYLEAAAKNGAWEQGDAVVRLKLAKREIEGRAQYYDPSTGRPVMAQDNVLYRMDDAGDRARYLANRYANPDGLTEEEFGWLGRADWDRRDRELRVRQTEGPRRATKLTREEIAASIPALKQQAEQAMTSQNPQGVWPRTDDRKGGIGESLVLVEHQPQAMLALLERCKILTGELQRDVWVYPGTPIPYISSLPGLDERDWTDLRKESPGRPAR